MNRPLRTVSIILCPTRVRRKKKLRMTLIFSWDVARLADKRPWVQSRSDRPHEIESGPGMPFRKQMRLQTPDPVLRRETAAEIAHHVHDGRLDRARGAGEGGALPPRGCHDVEVDV